MKADDERKPVQTMGESDASRIVVRGHDLCDLIGEVDFGGMVFLELVGRLPSEAENKMVNAVLVTLVEHGITANSLVTRLTYLASPEALQGAVAAGLLGAGSNFLGAIEGCAKVLQDLAAGDLDERERRVTAYVEEMRESGGRIPGIGHPVHKPDDPRTLKLYALADSLGFDDAHRGLSKELSAVAERVYERQLPINADGAIAAVLSDVGFPWEVCRGFAVIARSAGLVGHIWDERRRPIARHLWAVAEETVAYEDPKADF
ncbi:MAG TPA: citryl-CoA lyase [Solirubrobacterales bacterium]